MRGKVRKEIPMGVFTRLTDIINSNINSILEKAEDPNKIIRMVIQEMEDTLIEVRSGAARSIADQKDVERKLKKLTKAQNDWEKKAELAISKGRDDLAKGALIEKAKVADMAAHLEEELQALTNALGRHEEDVIKLDAKLREAKAKKATLQARHKTVSNHVRVKRNLYDNRIQDAFDRFERVETRLDRMEAEAESYDLGKGQTLSEEINGLEANEEIEKELEALKAKSVDDSGSAKKSAAH
jgi:phage shock protein A